MPGPGGEAAGAVSPPFGAGFLRLFGEKPYSQQECAPALAHGLDHCAALSGKPAVREDDDISWKEKESC